MLVSGFSIYIYAINSKWPYSIMPRLHVTRRAIIQQTYPKTKIAKIRPTVFSLTDIFIHRFV